MPDSSSAPPPPVATAPAADGPLLLYDGTCALCSRAVAFVLHHERARSARFAPLDGAHARAIRARHPELALADSLVWVEPPGDADSAVHVRSEAALRVAEYVGGPWRLVAGARIVPPSWRDAIYAWVARHRHHFFDGEAHCLVPPPAARARFLD